MHDMKTVSEDSTAWIIECMTCGRRILLDRSDMTKVVLDYGDESALHRWSSSPDVPPVVAELT